MGMNYLAHAFLSNNDTNLLIGNFIADHIRGNKLDGYPIPITEGIHLHRRIDSFTDTHALFKSSKRFFYDGFEKYSGVLVDIYFDHLLARNFALYSDIALKQFSENVYAVYSQAKNLLPENSSRFLDYVLKNDIYTSYASIEGIERVLFHLSHRINHSVQLNDSVRLFKRHEAQLQENFSVFFQEVIREFRGNKP
jgi:acyl carrier protein phosphodiesterase